jgi:hypothetical protein
VNGSTVIDSRTNRYSVTVMVRARELREAGWEYREIPAIVGRELGIEPNLKTIERWCRPAKREAKDLRRRRDWARRKRASQRQPRTDLTPEMKLTIMQELDSRGLSARAIGQVAAVWWGEELSDRQVHRQLNNHASERIVAA